MIAGGARWTMPAAFGGVVAALVLLVLAGRSLAAADLGTSVRQRTCDSSPLLGLGLLVVAGAALAVGIAASRLRREDVVAVPDLADGLPAVVACAVVVAGTLPGLLGCRAAARIERWDGFGPALVGTSGVALAGAALFGLGMSLVGLWTIEQLGGGVLAAEERPSIVELAIEEAEVYDEDPTHRRFRGVDDVE